MAHAGVDIDQDRWGFGIVSSLVLIPAFLVGYPDVPQTAAEAETYFGRNSTFVVANGVVPLLQVLGFIVFLGALLVLLKGAFAIRTSGWDSRQLPSEIPPSSALTLSAPGISANGEPPGWRTPGAPGDTLKPRSVVTCQRGWMAPSGVWTLTIADRSSPNSSRSLLARPELIA